MPSLPPGFVHLRTVDPSIRQDMRYAGVHNFLGRPVAGYRAPECILTRPAAAALAAAQAELRPVGLTLVVFDCYRPVRAVADFLAWSRRPADQPMRAEFFPRVDKARLFALGYLGARSAHSRGSTVDLAIAPAGLPGPPAWRPGDPLRDCGAAAGERFRDGTLDFGTGFDCLDPKSRRNAPGLPAEVRANRAMLRGLMTRHGFVPYDAEWWHYALAREPYPAAAFDIPVTAPPDVPDPPSRPGAPSAAGR